MSNYDIMNYQVRGLERKPKLDEDEGSSPFDKGFQAWLFLTVYNQ